MAEIPVEQALFTTAPGEGWQLRARSAGFADSWLAEAERVCLEFGERPAGVACPSCLFARPFAKRAVAVVRAADLPHPPGALGFSFLVLSRAAYAGLDGDPFALTERFLPRWQEHGELPTLTVPAVRPPSRMVEEVRQVLKSDHGPALLGAAQVIVDGGRLVFRRPAPAGELLRDLWVLLPASNRAELSPATFAFNGSLDFDVLVLPEGVRRPAEELAGYVTEEAAGDYPEGRYELRVQTAAEDGDQRWLDDLFARRSLAETWRLGLLLLVLSTLLAAGMGILQAVRK